MRHRTVSRALYSLALAAALSAAPLGAQTASLVKDINTDGPEYGSGFDQLTPAGNQVFFVSPAGNEARDLWVTEGAPETTHIVRGFCTGDCTSAISIAGAYKNLVLVSVRPGFGAPTHLWRSDGTRAGTFPLNLSVFLGSPVPFKGVVYLIGCADGGDSGCNLWKTDGSQAGTVLVKDVTPGATKASVSEIAAVGSRLFFTVIDANGDAALWSSDGTPSGTARLRALGHGTPSLLTAAGGRLFFAFNGDQESALWTSDGTAAGTRSLHAFSLVSPAFWGEGLHVLGGKVFFVAQDEVYGKELWTSDGTPAGTRRATGFAFDDIPLRQVRVAGNRIVFLASDGVHGLQIWSTTGTPESTVAVPSQPCSDGCSFLNDGTQLVEFGGRLLFFGVDDAHGAEPWVTDGTAAGTHLVADLCPGPCPSVSPYDTVAPATPQGLFFTATDPVHDEELWRTDGTSAGTVRLTDTAAPEVFFSGETAAVGAVGARVYFGFGDVDSGSALWVSERPGGARRVAVIAPHGPSSNPYALTAFGGNLLFVAGDGEESRSAQLWRSGGTEESTVPLGLDLLQYTDIRATPAAGLLFFLRENQHQERTLWRTDGTAAGTLPLLSFVDGGMTAYQGKLYFPYQSFSGPPYLSIWKSDGTVAGTTSAFALPAEIESVSHMTGLGPDLYISTGRIADEGGIWHSDGTLAGTQKIAAFDYVPSEDYDPHFTRLGSRVLFTIGTVWTTDGTPAGTAPLFPVDGAQGQGASDLTLFQGAAYFVASAGNKTGLWRTDGTAGGTALVKEIRVYLGSYPPRVYLVAGAGRLWLIADDGIHGEELWTSNGTAAGTHLLRDLNPGDEGSNPSGLTAVGDRLFFTATDGVHGLELWQSDGTAAGTRMVQDIAPLAASSAPAEMTAVGDRLYFSADDGPNGRELWSLPLSGAGCQASDTALCLGGRYRVEARWRDPQGRAGSGHAVPLTADTGTFWFFEPTNVEAIVKVLDGQGINGHTWVFYGALSDVEYTLTVTDTQTGFTRQYFNPQGQLASVGDTHGFGPLGAGSANPPRTVAPPSPLPLIAERTDKAAAVPCQPTAQRLCLNDDRFAVEVAWKDFQNRTGKGTAAPLSGDTGTFWFFNSANIELVVKILDGRPFNGKFWLFYGALSNVEYTLTVTDTQTGTVRTYRNPSGRFASVADTSAF